VALQLQKKGINRVHPLEGGLAAWMALNFPVRAIPPPLPSKERAKRVQSTAA